MLGGYRIRSVVHVLLLSASDADKSDDDVVSVRLHGEIAYGDARCRSGLSGNRSVCANVQVFRQGNHSAHVEYHGLLGRSVDGPSQGNLSDRREPADGD